MKTRQKTVIGLALLLSFVFVFAVWRLTTTTEAPNMIHVVKSGDTVVQICAVHGVRVKDLINANEGLDSRRLRIGQEIIIPNPPAMVRLGRKLDRLAAKAGLDDPPFARVAYKLTDGESK